MEASPLAGPAGQIEAGNVALFREHSIDVFEPSPRSKAPTGWYPDARHLGMDAGSQEFAAVEDQYIDTLLVHRAIPSSLGNIWPK